MANDKYTKNRNLWRKSYGYRRRKPIKETFTENETGNSYTLDLQQTVRDRDFFRIDTDNRTVAEVIPPLFPYAEYEEGTIFLSADFLETQGDMTSGMFVTPFSGKPFVTLELLDSNPGIEIFGLVSSVSGFDLGFTAVSNITFKYRAIYAPSGYPALYLGSDSQVFTGSAGNTNLVNEDSYLGSFSYQTIAGGVVDSYTGLWDPDEIIPWTSNVSDTITGTSVGLWNGLVAGDLTSNTDVNVNYIVTFGDSHTQIKLIDLSEGTFSRASSSTYWHETNTGNAFFRYPAEELRVVYQDDTKGYVLEEARTNLVRSSNDATGTGWQLGGTTSITYGFTDPANTAQASRIVYPASVSAAFCQVLTMADNTKHSMSIFMRVESGLGAIKIIFRGNDGVNIATDNVALTSNWVRYDILDGDSAAGVPGATGIYLQNIDGLAKTIDVFGAQVEEGRYITSLIETTGATVTRARDNLVVTTDSVDTLNQGFVYKHQPYDSSSTYDHVGLTFRRNVYPTWDIRFSTGTPTTLSSYYEDDTPALYLNNLEWSDGDVLTITNDPTMPLLRIEGMTSGPTMIEDIVGNITIPPVGDFIPIQTSGANLATGWISDIYTSGSLIT